MRKSIVYRNVDHTVSSSDQWLDLEEIATAEISSEDPLCPFENALYGTERSGWRASTPGPQTIRLTLDEPRSIRRIRLEFREDGPERVQEFALYATTTNQARKEVLRQQWTFSPHGSTEEIEDYHVELSAVTQLEVKIIPDTRGGFAHATLTKLQLA